MPGAQRLQLDDLTWHTDPLAKTRGFVGQSSWLTNPTIWVLDYLGFVGAWNGQFLGKRLMLFGGNFWHRIPRSTGPETIPSLKQKYWTQRWFLVRRMLRPFLINWFEGFKRLSCTPFFDIWEFPVHITKGFLEEKGCEAWRNSYRLETIDYFA